MSENEAPAHGSYNRERAITKITIKYYNTRNALIASVLPHGRENAITAGEIKRILEFRDTREVSKIVERERHGGVPICATTDAKCPGYYLPENESELSAYTASLRRRVKNVSATLYAMESALDSWTGQTRIDNFGG